MVIAQKIESDMALNSAWLDLSKRQENVLLRYFLVFQTQEVGNVTFKVWDVDDELNQVTYLYPP